MSMMLPTSTSRPIKSGCASATCGRPASITPALPTAIQAKINNHPCFSEDAHHHYARMHVAVAPGCNIQCNYCNRKYDCANESRPGVVSQLLTPEQAVRKVLAVAAAIPQLSVIGIAGPGDPLANPRRTFATLGALAVQAPDLKLCLSTNGLVLPQLIDQLCAYNIEHVTITINCLDPEIGAQIYPWIIWNHRRIKGVEAARILIEQQQLGLEMLIARGVLVKVNSVMIPGVNDAHLREVSQVVQSKGAFLHNVMPLIAAPEHGTVYGLNGQRSPTATELQTLQDACAGNMRMMRHCRQCRADAIGLLGEDRSADFESAHVDAAALDYTAAMQRRTTVHAAIELQRAALKQQVPPTPTNRRMSGCHPAMPILPATAAPLIVAVATTGNGVINGAFDQVREFLIYAVNTEQVQLIGTRKIPVLNTEYTIDNAAALAIENRLTVLAGCQAVLCATIGYAAWQQLEQAGITPNSEYAQQPIEHAIGAVYREIVHEHLQQSPVAPAAVLRSA